MLNKTTLLNSVLVFLIVLLSCKDDRKKIKQTDISFKKEANLSVYKKDGGVVDFDIEIADTEYEIQTGLMYRDSMKKKQGMLFVFETEAPRSFYMKNTKIPLDLIFIDKNHLIVSFQKNAKPFDETSLPSHKPAKYVLEINTHLVDKWGITVGDSISHTY